MNRIEVSASNSAETIRTPSVRDTGGGSKNRTKLEAVKELFRKAASAITRDNGQPSKTKTRGRTGRGRGGGSEGRGMFPRTMPRHVRRQRTHRYVTLWQPSGARTTSATVGFLAAAGEMMKDVREAFESAVGSRLARERIERRQAEMSETRAGAGGSVFMSETLDRMHLWQHDQAASGGSPGGAMPGASNHLSPQ
jgi:hypothetical protein